MCSFLFALPIFWGMVAVFDYGVIVYSALLLGFALGGIQEIIQPFMLSLLPLGCLLINFVSGKIKELKHI